MMQSDSIGRPDSQTGTHSFETSPPVVEQPQFTSPVSAPSIFEGRLHPLTIAFGLLKAARGIIPAVPLILFGNKIYGLILLLMIVISTVATSLARYFSFSYRI